MTAKNAAVIGSFEMKGRRVFPDADGEIIRQLTQEGDFGKDSRGRWFARPPRLKEVTGVWLNNPNYSWKITEHEDGTITCSPSIWCNKGYPEYGEWHGFLERGDWREC